MQVLTVFKESLMMWRFDGKWNPCNEVWPSNIYTQM